MSSPHSTPERTASADATRWFMDEVHPHDASLQAYLRSAFPAVRDIDDVVQESYLRTWKAKLAHPITSTKSFLFRVARNLAIDAVRRKHSAPAEISVDMDGVSVLEGSPNVAITLSRREKIDLLIAALATLPERTREILFLRKFQCMSQRDVAARLRISERTVETQLAKGMKRCADYLRRRGVQGFLCDE